MLVDAEKWKNGYAFKIKFVVAVFPFFLPSHNAICHPESPENRSGAEILRGEGSPDVLLRRFFNGYAAELQIRLSWGAD